MVTTAMPVVLLFTFVHAPVRDGPHAASVVADGPDEPPALVHVCRDQRPIRQLPARTEAGRLPRDVDPRLGTRSRPTEVVSRWMQSIGGCHGIRPQRSISSAAPLGG